MSAVLVQALGDDAGTWEEAGRLWYASAREAHPWLPMLQTLPEADAVRIFSAMTEGATLYGVRDGGTLAGLLALEGEWVERLYVSTASQGRGIGDALLAHARALRPDGLRLYTHQLNARARAFYERRGFRPVRFGLSPPPESVPDVEYHWPGTDC